MHRSWSNIILHWNLHYLSNFNHLTVIFQNSKFSKYKLSWEEIVTFFKGYFFSKWPPNDNDPLNLKNHKWPLSVFHKYPPIKGEGEPNVTTIWWGIFAALSVSFHIHNFVRLVLIILLTFIYIYIMYIIDFCVFCEKILMNYSK